ncbi:UNVERIFIED_CONTAM: hypothetical protein HDU68_007019 [Siphonaria sp. JEL0065]|nr:hypothetical protein HDU68_007019 [Siphonaria sp. JEL0065]
MADNSNHEWNQFVNSMNTAPSNSEFQYHSNATSSGSDLSDLTAASSYSNLEDYTNQYHLHQQYLRDQFQQSQSHQQQLSQPQHAPSLSQDKIKKVAKTPYARPNVSNPLATSISKTVTPQEFASNQFPQAISNGFSTDGLLSANFSTSSSSFSDLFGQPPKPPQKAPSVQSVDGNDSDPPANDNNRVERGRRVHREAEKQRRESLRNGFEKLKDLLPASTVGADKNWSQTRLLETGLEYIVALQREADTKLAENIKLKDALRKVVAIHTESENDP